MRIIARRRVALVILGVPLTILLATLYSTPAYAHGFGARYDLPLPLWLYIFAAGAAVVLSFVVMTLFIRGGTNPYDYPRFNIIHSRFTKILAHPFLVLPIKFVSVSVFVIVIAAGSIGDQTPNDNFAPTWVWVIWWIGLAYISALVGNIWIIVNPWRIIFGWGEALYQIITRTDGHREHVKYPKELGHWPAILLFIAFSWAELIYRDSADPVRIAQMVLVYSMITWAGMLVFGKENWVRHGECFSVFSSLLGRFAPTEIRVTDTLVCLKCNAECADLEDTCIGCWDCFTRAQSHQKEFNIRPFAIGLLNSPDASTSTMFFVLIILASVTFDGFTSTPAWSEIAITLFSVITIPSIIGSLGLGAFVLLFIGIYLGFSGLISIATGHRMSVFNTSRVFVYSLIPIALAYHLAHYFSFLLIQGQLIIPLASDPFGFGWNILNTADYKINISIVNAKFVWITAVATIIIGHILAVYLAHVVAMKKLTQRHDAIRSQYPMLVLMVGYTMISLWILAQPIVETGTRG